MAIKRLSMDTPVGQIKQGDLIAQVSVRNGLIILTVGKPAGKGVEVAFALSAASDIAEHIRRAVALLNDGKTN